MLYMIGLGLDGPNDITIKGVNALKKSSRIFIDNYTSKFSGSIISDFEKEFNIKIEQLSREKIEDNSLILDCAINDDVSFLVIGDVFSATTHFELFLRAKENNIEVDVIHNASIFNVISITGLHLYKFGKTTSIVRPEKSWFPTSSYDVIKKNLSMDAHTLCLLDIKVDENYYMSVNEALHILLEMEDQRNEHILSNDTFVIGCARLGSDFKIISGKVKDLIDVDFGKPLHSLIIPSQLHFSEQEVLDFWNNKFIK